MGFAQLYYTSCESGLSDFAGFQFNAATPGLSPQTLREVEALTSYEPPRALGYRPSPDEIAGCPVNLVYRCEPTMVLANVVFVGLDFSQRLGNYFAHALVGQTDADRVEQILPIELWGSPFWVGEPIAERELPALAELPDPGARPISRDGVDRFLARQRRAGPLAALVSAAETAVLRQGRSLVLIEADSTAAAQWIAAISFLLPPAVARRMSFATYRHRPEYSDAHVIATLPDSDFDLDESTFHSYVVFDPASGRISEVATEPAAELLVRAGSQSAAELWRRAGDLVDLTDPTLARSFPVLVAAAVLARLPVTHAELDILGDWLATDPDGLNPADRSAVLEAALAQLDLVVAQHPDAVIELFTGRLGELIEDDQQLTPALYRAALLARCRRDLLAPGTIEDDRPTGDRPGPQWPVRDWLVRAIVEPDRDRRYLPAYLTLCRAIEDGTVTVSLPGAAQLAVSSFLTAVRELEQARTEPDQVQASVLWRLAGSYPQQGAVVQDLLRESLPVLIDELGHSPFLADAVASCPPEVRAGYLALVSRRATRSPADLEGVARLVQTLQTLRAGKDRVLAPELDEALRRGLRPWLPQDLDHLRDCLRRNDPQSASKFSEWRGQHLGGVLRRTLRRLGPHRSRR